MPDAELVRCFIAIELPPEVKSSLAQLQDRLRQGGFSGVRWVDPEGIHLTLKFLGPVAAHRLPQIKECLAQAAQGIGPFSLELAGTGVFPNPSRPRVAWVGLSGEVEKLAQLQKDIDLELVPLGFPREARGFTPHLTLARLREGTAPQERQRFGRQVVSTSFEAPVPVPVEQISLIRSQLTPGGAIYTHLASVGLGNILSKPQD
ncbi:MAG: RNA 2',3'-cyclic phosphodiesterase [Dehalococcoidia bacterium]